jgi:hypothetical protein
MQVELDRHFLNKLPDAEKEKLLEREATPEPYDEAEMLKLLESPAVKNVRVFKSATAERNARKRKRKAQRKARKKSR